VPDYAPIVIEGRPLTKDRYHGVVNDRGVSAGYFEVFRIPLRRGRMFTERDAEHTPAVVLINEAMAKQFWPNGNPVGQRITTDMGTQYEEPRRQIIGVVADVRDEALVSNPEPMMYELISQTIDAVNAGDNRGSAMIWAVRTKPDPYSLRADVERELR